MRKSKLITLKKLAIQARKDCMETQITVGSGHLGGSFSALEMMIYLYFEEMNIDPKKPWKNDRDIFILSKGHASLGYYCVLAQRGYIPKEELKTYRKVNSRLQGHTHADVLPGVECSTGSLGQGLSFALGMALGYKRKDMSNRVFVIVGDGEMQEGQNWEALMMQGRLKLDNLIPIIDYNRLQLDDCIDEVLGAFKLKQKLEAFDQNVIEIDGHDFEDIKRAFDNIKVGRANIILANTVKGKGISFMENSVPWHAQKLTQEEYKGALEELEKMEVTLND
ncbi:transketolase [Alkalicella caledoniensis]|uniref:Transketolase n=1 Tax=Alkalicella caledoniensis TaxID=2731377 RepID=A0A7G9WAX7_ALKCA|nr:transketolase [Alkalicella caledoniensis]QNO15839.1 transketolase [Alkalicella caledoniensis]